MKSKLSVIAGVLLVAQASWMVPSAHAQPHDKGKPERSQKQKKQDLGQDQQSAPHKSRPQMPMHEARQGLQAPSYSGQVQIGGYFQQQHRDAARDYYDRPENRGFCPPGLAKKGNGCLPPGQAKKWRQGYPLPTSVVVYEVPRSVVLTLGVPPPGYRYVRVASDILLIAIGTGMVIDAIEGLVR